MTDLSNATFLLRSGDYTCVLCKGENTVTSQFRGVRPLVRWYAEGQDFSGYCAADKVVGKATAFLYVLLKVKAVYAGILSQSARQVLEAQGIEIRYGSLVKNIINRKGDGICPFEEAVLEISGPQAAYTAIRKKMEQLQISL